MVQLALYLFGSPYFERDGQPVSLDRRKAIALSAFLALTGEAQARDTLAALFWPEYDSPRALAALRRTLAALKKANCHEWLVITRKTITPDLENNIWVDVLAFQDYLAQGRLEAERNRASVQPDPLVQALHLYRADFLAGFTLRDCPSFDEWQLFQTESLRRRVMGVLDRLVRFHLAQQDRPTAIDYARRWVELDPLAEIAHRQLMHLYAANNQRSAALRQYQACAKILQTELGVEPSQETVLLYQDIQQGLIVPENDRVPGSPLAPSLFGKKLPSLPAQSTPFIGRQADLREIVTRLANPNCQLLTLIGPGGIGKTRLAIQAGIETQPQFRDGVYFLPLAFVQTADFLASAIADALNLSVDGSSDPFHQLLSYLHDKQLLLILDNFEHLVPEAHRIIALMAQAPQVKLLVTSRERLNLHGEWAFEIKGMSYPPDPASVLNLGEIDLEQYQAIALFVQSASRVHSGFVFRDDEKPYVVRICQLVEGVPLAIELAAAWVRHLSCQEIAKEIERMIERQGNLDFLTTSLQDVPSRHRSLQAVFDHSWQLLAANEQQLFQKLAVFRGGCRLKAIEQVTGAGLAALSALIDKSLISRDEAGRYQMHELLRQYALEKLAQTKADAQAIQKSHAHYFVTFLYQYEQVLKGSKQEEILGLINEEIENIRLAWQWSVSTSNVTQVKRAIKGLSRFYSMYSRFQEGNDVFGQAVTAVRALDQAPHLSLIGQLLTYQGWFLLRQGRYVEAEHILFESLATFDQINDQENRAVALQYVGILSSEIGNYERGQQYLADSLTIFRAIPDHWEVAWTLSHLGNCVSRAALANQSEAKQLLQESLTMYQELGGRQGVAIALHNLGNVALRQGDYQAAKQTLLESLLVRREIGYPRGIAVTLNKLGKATGLLGDYQASQQYYQEGLQIALQIGAIPLALEALGGLAVPIAKAGNSPQAKELLTLVLQHPASSNEVRHHATQLAQHICDDVKTALPSNVEIDPHQLFERLVEKIKKD